MERKRAERAGRKGYHEAFRERMAAEAAEREREAERERGKEWSVKSRCYAYGIRL